MYQFVIVKIENNVINIIRILLGQMNADLNL